MRAQGRVRWLMVCVILVGVGVLQMMGVDRYNGLWSDRWRASSVLKVDKWRFKGRSWVIRM